MCSQPLWVQAFRFPTDVVHEDIRARAVEEGSHAEEKMVSLVTQLFEQIAIRMHPQDSMDVLDLRAHRIRERLEQGNLKNIGWDDIDISSFMEVYWQDSEPAGVTSDICDPSDIVLQFLEPCGTGESASTDARVGTQLRDELPQLDEWWSDHEIVVVDVKPTESLVEESTSSGFVHDRDLECFSVCCHISQGGHI